MTDPYRMVSVPAWALSDLAMAASVFTPRSLGLASAIRTAASALEAGGDAK